MSQNSRVPLVLGLAIVGVAVIALPWWFLGDSPAAPNRVLEGRGRAMGGAGYSFALAKETQGGLGEIGFDDVKLELLGSDFIDLGPVALVDVKEAPPYAKATWSAACHVTVGHTYCARLKDGTAYVKLRVTDCAQRVRKGHIFKKEAPGFVSFEWVMQPDGSGSFVRQPRVVSPQEALRRTGKSLEEERQKLEAKLAEEIPAFRKTLAEQAQAVKADLDRADKEATKQTLERELKDIARYMLTLDAYEADCRESVLAVKSSLRQVERVLALPPDEAGKLVAELDKIEQSAAVLSEKQLINLKAPTGALSDLAVDKKYQELAAPTKGPER